MWKTERKRPCSVCIPPISGVGLAKIMTIFRIVGLRVGKWTWTPAETTQNANKSTDNFVSSLPSCIFSHHNVQKPRHTPCVTATQLLRTVAKLLYITTNSVHTNTYIRRYFYTTILEVIRRSACESSWVSDCSSTLTINWWLPVAMLDPCIGWQAIQEFTWGQTYASSWIHMYAHIRNLHLPKNFVLNSHMAQLHTGYINKVTTKTKYEIYKKWQLTSFRKFKFFILFIPCIVIN
jgi:hypothetical protein